MLFSEPTKRGVGLTLYGDYNDLRSLHGTIHALCGNGDGGYNDHQEHTLSIAYELRKAYEEKREIKIFNNGSSKYFGTNLPWPSLLFYSSHLRQQAGFFPTNKEHQSNLFRFEYCIESALLSYDHNIGSEILERFSSLGFVSKDFLFSFVEDVTYRYIYEGSTGKIRFKRLPQLLRSLSHWSEEYEKFQKYMTDQAEQKKCTVYQLHDIREWPDFEW